MEITERLRNTPTGFTVKVGEINIQVKRFVPNIKTKATICNGCAFRDEGARFCEYSSACMEDGNSVTVPPGHTSGRFSGISVRSSTINCTIAYQRCRFPVGTR